jgi:hypothetical protein
MALNNLPTKAELVHLVEYRLYLEDVLITLNKRFKIFLINKYCIVNLKTEIK